MRLPISPWSYLAPFRRYCRFMCSWPHPYSTLIWECSRCTRSPTPMLGSVSKLISHKIIFQVFQPMWSQSTNVTDGQQDNMRSQWTQFALARQSSQVKYTVSQKKRSKIIFVITSSNFHQLWQFLAQRWQIDQNYMRCTHFSPHLICVTTLPCETQMFQIVT